MHNVSLTVGTRTLKYQYLVGNHTVGIITPKRKRFTVRIGDILREANGLFQNEAKPEAGSSDTRVPPESVAAYVMKHKLY